MEKHKEKALEEGCLCYKCPYRFQCFTQERIFSDPLYQGLFEALMAKGRSREEAIEEVSNELKNRISGNLHITVGDPAPNSVPYYPITTPYWTYVMDCCDNVSVQPQGDGTVQVSYTLLDGEEITWNAGNNV